MKKYFNNKKTVFSFLIYLLITFTIFSSALKSGEESKSQSDGFSTVFSDVVSFFTFDNVNLKNDGKTQDYPKSVKLIIPNQEFMVGQTFEISHEFNDKKSYPCAKVVYSSSNEDVITVDSYGKCYVKGVGSCTLTAKVQNTDVVYSETIQVGNGVYTPVFYINGYQNQIPQTINANLSSSVVGAIYNFTLITDSNDNQVSITSSDESAIQIISTSKNVFFYTKKVGSYYISATLTYENVNGKNQKKTITQPITVSINDELPSPTKPVINYENNGEVKDLTVLNTQATFIPLNYDLTDYLDQKNRFHPVVVYEDKVLGVGYPETDEGVDGTKIAIIGKTLGETRLKFYYLSQNGLEKLEFNVLVVQGTPKTSSIKSGFNYVAIDGNLTLTVLGDNKTISSDLFNWEVSDTSIATIKNGVLSGKKYGKITVVATAKFDENFKISKTFTVRRPYDYIVRKAFGHFSIFLLLGLFALTVYTRLSEITFKKYKTAIGFAFAFIAGFITAVISEFLQGLTFVGGRTPSFNDVLIDFSGFFIGLSLIFIITRFIKFIKNKKAE